MTRIYVTEIDTDSDNYDPGFNEPVRRAGFFIQTGFNGPVRHAGFFTREAATYWHGNKEWDGQNQADVNTKDAHRGQGLYRTAQGRWVLTTWSNWQGEEETHTYATEADARDWLIFNGYDEAAAEHFGSVEDERGPGRPEIGAPIQVRLGDLLPEVDDWAKRRGMKRAEAVRQLVAAALQADV